MSQALPPREVLQVHTRYRQAGGEEQVVEAERRLLEAAGVSVRQVIFDNAEIREAASLAGDLRLAQSAIWSRRAERRVRAAIAAHRPDVVHVHNTFAAASPSVFAAADGVPVVHTLHNYRMICPVATLFRDGRPCTDCVGRFIPWPGVLHACVRGSRSQSAVAAATLVVHRALGTFDRRIGIYIALTEFQRTLMVDGGVPAGRIRVVPNFLEPDPGTGGGQRSGMLYVGRLSTEKGIDTLLRAAAQVPGVLRIAGTGPLAGEVEQASGAGHVTYLGALARWSVLNEMRRASALVMPSAWYEGFPLTVVEAYATGTPVIASEIGSLAELVEEGVTGLLTQPQDAQALAARMRWATDHAEEMEGMGASARNRYETRYRGASHLSALIGAFEAAGARRQPALA